MSNENLQPKFEDYIENLNKELDVVDQKYPDDGESDNCAKCLEKLNVYTRYTMGLINNGWHYLGKLGYENISNFNVSLCTDVPAAIQVDFKVVRDSFENPNQLKEQAIDSLLKGKS